jgi:hypothetical protein
VLTAPVARDRISWKPEPTTKEVAECLTDLSKTANVEVILPYTLREQMAQEMLEMSQLYSDVTNSQLT